MTIYHHIIVSTFILGIIINIILKAKFKKYSQQTLEKNFTGKQIAERMLSYYNIHDVEIRYAYGNLSDSYDPIKKRINLSYNTFYNSNAASIAVAAHECGHAVQHHLGYKLLYLRNKLCPIVSISARFSNFLIMFGLSMFYNSHGQNTFLLKLGMSLFLTIVAFTIITLPIEFDASRRALYWIKNEHMVTPNEYKQAKDALKWAAMTYVIGALGIISQLIYFLSVINHNRKK